MSLQVPLPESYWDGFVKGVNFSIPGTGGAECVAFIPDWQKACETLFALAVSFCFTYAGWRKVKVDTKPQQYEDERISPYRQLLLVALVLTFGVEVGYKLSTSSVIWLANPCHILTMVQIILLAAPPRKWVTVVFRIMMHSMHGAVVALLLPVTNTRMFTYSVRQAQFGPLLIGYLKPSGSWCYLEIELPFEVVVYWVQHILIVSIPFFLLYQRGPYVVEPLKNWWWAIMTLGILYFIYWIPVQGLCILTEVNLNNMVCPAISDPFYGRGYRLWAMGHCGICILGFGKLYTFISLNILNKISPEHRRASLNGTTSPPASNGHLATKRD